MAPVILKFLILSFKQVLLPVLKPGQVIILDNASFHKSVKTRDLIGGVGCKLLFLPPYSPDLNPIEQFWANFKAKIKSIIGNFNKLRLYLQRAVLNLIYYNRVIDVAIGPATNCVNTIGTCVMKAMLQGLED